MIYLIYRFLPLNFDVGYDIIAKKLNVMIDDILD